ncbi:hypothetical protein MTP99_004621 [Tenebrio molitor]|nr:hypothetical protein MTP99_004621 [Tenebrio molitor]
MALVYLSSSASDSSDDEDIINFVVNLGGIRKNPRLQIRRNHLEYWDDQEFYIRFRLSKNTVVLLLEEIRENIQHNTNWNHALTPMEMILATLRFFASGSFLIVVGDFCGVHKSTISKVVFKVARALANLRGRYIKFPATEEEKTYAQQQFYQIARFPRVLGALDCTHIKIKSPGKYLFPLNIFLRNICYFRWK